MHGLWAWHLDGSTPELRVPHVGTTTLISPYMASIYGPMIQGFVPNLKCITWVGNQSIFTALLLAKPLDC